MQTAHRYENDFQVFQFNISYLMTQTYHPCPYSWPLSTSNTLISVLLLLSPPTIFSNLRFRLHSLSVYIFRTALVLPHDREAPK
jgi:hypothetical protein